MLDQQLPKCNARIGTHLVNWWGHASHIDVGYHSDDPKTTARQMAQMQSLGIVWASLNWRGDRVNTVQHTATQNWIEAASNSGYSFKVRLMVDVGMFPKAVTNPTQELIDQLTRLNPWRWSACEKKLMEFGTETLAVKIDWARIQAAFPDVLIQLRKRDYVWCDNLTDPVGYLTACYAASPRVTTGALFYQFNDAYPDDPTVRVWPDPITGKRILPPRYMYHKQGRLWYQTWDLLPNWMTEAQIITWDDYEEGTAMEDKLGIGPGVRPPSFAAPTNV